MVIPQTTLATKMDEFHCLDKKWCLWAHLPHDTDWSIKSYIPISTFTTVEDTLAVTETLPSIMVENCMLFLMRNGIKPIWQYRKSMLVRFA